MIINRFINPINN